jgi:hypothetical protein
MEEWIRIKVKRYNIYWFLYKSEINYMFSNTTPKPFAYFSQITHLNFIYLFIPLVYVNKSDHRSVQIMIVHLHPTCCCAYFRLFIHPTYSMKRMIYMDPNYVANYVVSSNSLSDWARWLRRWRRKLIIIIFSSIH